MLEAKDAMQQVQEPAYARTAALIQLYSFKA